mgnify:CR=1 FL=1
MAEEAQWAVDDNTWDEGEVAADAAVYAYFQAAAASIAAESATTAAEAAVVGL